jgi:hypothetical protein
VLSLSAAIFFGQPILAKQLDDWRLLPRPERVTEFYFSDYRHTPVPGNTGKTRTIEFTVHNLEHQATDYHYTLLAISADGRVEQSVGSGGFTLLHDHSLKTTKLITLPPIAGRFIVKAKLEYVGVAWGDRTPSTQMQSIHFWTAAPKPGEKEKI